MSKRFGFKMIISIVISMAVAFIVYLVNGIFFCVNDDYTMASIVANDKVFHNGEYNVFSNIVLGKIEKSLYLINESINWYGVLMILFLIISFAILIYIFWNTIKKIAIIIPIVLIEVLSIFYISFTTVAFILTLTSVLLGIYIVLNKEYLKTKKTIIGLVVSSVLFIVGFMYRYESFVIAVVILIPLLIYYRKRITKKIIIGIVINILIVISLNVFHNYQYNHNGWKGYSDYLSARSIIDYKPIDYDRHQKELSDINVTKNDLDCFYHWIYADKQVFSEKKINQMKDMRSLDEKYTLDILSIVKQMILNEMNIILLLVAIAGLICLGRREKKYILLTWIIIVGMSVALIILQRFIGRVYLPMIVVGIMEMLFFIRNNSDYKKTTVMITIISVVMISVVGYKYYAMKKEFVPAEVNKPVLEYINNNPETLFLMNSSAKDVIELSRKSIFTKASSETNIQTVGGWMLYHKDYYEKLNNKVSDPDRLIVAMTKDKKILFVDGKTDNNNYKRMQKFIFEHTGKKMTRRIEKDFKGLDIAIYRFDYK